MIKNTLVLFTLLISLSISGQEAISTQGDSYSNTNGSICFTIGETVIFSGTDGTNSISQGFHQSTWTLVNVEDHIANYDANIFPNPTEDVLNIQCSEFEDVIYTLMDAQGKVVLQNKLITDRTSLEVGQFTSGTYLLQLSKGSQNLRTFKLIKTQ